MSDITLQALSVDVLPVEEDAQFLTIGVLTGIQLPTGPNQVTAIPTDVYRVNMGKDAVTELIGELQAAAEKLPEAKRPSGIVVPGSPNEADQIANDLRRMGG